MPNLSNSDFCCQSLSASARHANQPGLRTANTSAGRSAQSEPAVRFPAHFDGSLLANSRNGAVVGKFNSWAFERGDMAADGRPYGSEGLLL